MIIFYHKWYLLQAENYKSTLHSLNLVQLRANKAIFCVLIWPGLVSGLFLFVF